MRNFLKRSEKRKQDPIAIEKLRDEKTLLVTFEEMSRIPYDEIEDIYKERPKAVTCTRIKTPNKDTLSFRVTMEKGEEWHNHFHDCEENIIVYEGSIYNSINKKTASRMDILKIEPYEKHIIKSLEKTVFYVEFIKSKK